MAEGNGEIIEEMATAVKTTETTVETERTPDYPKLVEYGLDKRVCATIPSHQHTNPLFYNLFFFFFLFESERWPVN